MKGIMLNQEAQNSINESVLCWLATASENGEPNVSPKEMFIANGNEHILIANIASPNSVKNIRSNPLVCVSFINVFKQKGFKVKGSAKVIEINNEEFQGKELILRTLGGEKFEIKSIIEILVSSFRPIVAPSYLMFPETTESSQVKQAMDTYGVQPKIV
jgi:predicted pyridoxine 5'-phosphate oxidase superfamily flavin-nucleotide-binding protein